MEGRCLNNSRSTKREIVMVTVQEARSANAPAARSKPRGLFAVIDFVGRAGEIARQRRALAKLGDSALKDFGASRADAVNEADRPWWDLPRER
jgi:uncharacterized protein YjiS (DUF1127 family)